MNINYISAALIPNYLFSPIFQFEISYANYVLIQSNPNALNVNYNGGLINVNNDIYPSATVQPFGTLWNIFEGAVGGGHWYISFIVPQNNRYFDDITKWLNFNGPYSPAITGVTNTITIVSQPQALMAGYNPIPFTFYSPNYAKDGYRYLVSITAGNQSTLLANQSIATFKVVPAPDGSGYIDIQKVLSSFLSVDFEANSNYNTNAINSYFDYNISFGEEYTAVYPYTSLRKNVTTGIFSGYTVLEQSNPSIINSYVAGNQIDIKTISTGITATINGLRQIVQIIDNHTFVIDAVYPTTASTIAISGTTHFADNKKQGYLNLTNITGQTVFNGALSQFDYIYWDQEKHILQFNPTGETTDQVWLLTSLNNSSAISSGLLNENDNVISLTPTQSVWLNFYTDKPNLMHYLAFSVVSLDGTSVDYSTPIFNSGSNGPVKQFLIGWEPLGLEPQIGDIIYFRITNENGDPFTRYYNFGVDMRCQIEEYEIAFMDKMGSILSIPFYLRNSEKITIVRDTNKQQISYVNSNTYLTNLKLGDRGTNVNSVQVSKAYELNSNWMNDGMLNLFEEMMSSPFTWLKMKDYDKYNNSFSINYYSITIEDKDFQVEKQKNKRLIKKTVQIKLANDNPTNI